MSTITVNATMEVLYYAVGVIGSIKIVKDLFKPKDKIENIVKEEDYDGDSEEERMKKYWDEDGLPIANFEYDKAMYEASDQYANMIDKKIFESGEYYDEEYEPDYGQYCNVEEEEKRPVE